MNCYQFQPGEVVRHFKYELLTEEEKSAKKYLYEIVGIAIHTETEEHLVIYRALYGKGELFARPYESFVCEVDHKKYPHIKQKRRFEKTCLD